MASQFRQTAQAVVVDIIRGIINFFLTLLGEKKKDLVKADLARTLVPVKKAKTPNGSVAFVCPGAIPLYQIKHLHTREPETINWLESIPAGDILWDIGANIGTFSVYAAKMGAKVVAFEPASVNFANLQENIALNKLDHLIQAYCIAFSDATSLISLNMTASEVGSALHKVGESEDELVLRGREKEVVFRQATICYSVDEFVAHFSLPTPNHIKLDVDGIEAQIIRGAKNTLASPSLKTLLVELDKEDPDYPEILEIIQGAGLALSAINNERVIEQAVGHKAIESEHIFVRKMKS